MEHTFPTRADADQFMAEHHPGAETMAAVTTLLGNPVLLDREQQVVIRIHDWSDDEEEPVVNIDHTSARNFIRDQDLADQAAILLEQHDTEPEHLKAVFADLIAIGGAGAPPAWAHDPRLGMLMRSEAIRGELESALATVNAVADHVARDVWSDRSATGATLAEVAKELHVEPGMLASMITADRRRTLDL
ncbi:hypothetical protein [Glycomyces harbinensis]|uniref:Uncharacterized protein n=1 Tax=Glycomyces harbinensis TaxID=58114 RepID=A0A1G6YD60_9ACTN|nr:hypothetical protein [Glycomyces harbinensis]SDD87526.1 hypothetical protein SAMN05216270_108234 [Glycomyces harbinensis]